MEGREAGAVEGVGWYRIRGRNAAPVALLSRARPGPPGLARGALCGAGLIVLLTNDDGVEAAGLRALERALADVGECWTVAPATEQSARSHALTMHEPLRLQPAGERRWAVTGTPADSVYLALHHLLPERPALVVSGINRGSNLATDIYYSGTVAAAREASLLGIPAVAASLHLAGREPRWETAEGVVRRLVDAVLTHPLPPGTLLNLNVPSVPPGELRGLRVAAVGRRHYAPMVDSKVDPRGRAYFWIGGEHDRFDDRPDTDGPLCEAGYAVVSPLHMDPTDHAFLAELRRWNIER